MHVCNVSMCIFDAFMCLCGWGWRETTRDHHRYANHSHEVHTTHRQTHNNQHPCTPHNTLPPSHSPETICSVSSAAVSPSDDASASTGNAGAGSVRVAVASKIVIIICMFMFSFACALWMCLVAFGGRAPHRLPQPRVDWTRHSIGAHPRRYRHVHHHLHS